MQGNREKCLAVGMSDYLRKPILVHELHAALECGKRAVRHPLQLADPSAKSPKFDGTFHMGGRNTLFVPIRCGRIP
jgi:DNA-binding response OmpR family regulator